MCGFHTGKYFNHIIINAYIAYYDRFICLFAFRIRKEESRTNHLQLIESKNQTNANEVNLNLWPTEIYIWIYSGIILTLLILASVRSIIYAQVCKNASKNLHKSMFQSLMSTSMRFFAENSSGRIMNRITCDLGIVDQLVPNTLLDVSQMNLKMFGAIAVTIFADVKLSIVILIMGFFFLPICKIYLKCSTNIKHLDAISIFHLLLEAKFDLIHSF